MPEPLVHRSASGRVYQTRSHYPAKTALIGFVERQGDAASDMLLQLRWFQSTYWHRVRMLTHSCVNDFWNVCLKEFVCECRIGDNDVSLLYAIASPQWCKKTLSVSLNIYKQRFDGIVNLCSLKSTDYWVQVFNEEEDDLLDTVRDFSSAMYDNFHHLAPEIIEARSGHCARTKTSGSHCTRRCAESKNVSYVHIFRATPGQNRLNGLSIQSRFFYARSRHLQRFREIDFILGLMSRQPVTVCTCEAVNKTIDQWKGLYTDKCFQIHLGDDHDLQHCSRHSQGSGRLKRRLHRRFETFTKFSWGSSWSCFYKTSPWVNTASQSVTYFNFDMHGCRTDFQRRTSRSADLWSHSVEQWWTMSFTAHDADKICIKPSHTDLNTFFQSSNRILAGACVLPSPSILENFWVIGPY
jgi:hypothetical protein